MNKDRVELNHQEMTAKGLNIPSQEFRKIQDSFEKLEEWAEHAYGTDKGVTENILSGVDSMRTRLNLIKVNIANILGISSRS